MEAVQHRVVGNVDDGGHRTRDDTHEPCEHPRGPDAAAQGHQHATKHTRTPGVRPSGHPWYHRRPPCQCASPWIGRETVVEVLREAARVNGHLEAYVEHDGRGSRRVLTFADWDRAADGVAGHLARRGVVKGDVVCLLLPSSIDYAVLYAGLLRLGAITSGINRRMGPGEVSSILERAAPVLLVVDPEAASPPPRGGWTSCPGPSGVVVGRRPSRHLAGAGARGPGGGGLDQRDDGTAQGRHVRPCHLAAVARGNDVLRQPGDRRVSPVPFAHVGYIDAGLGRDRHTVTTILTPTPWRADDAIRAMAAEGVTVAQGVPTQWALMLASDELAHADLGALRVAATSRRA